MKFSIFLVFSCLFSCIACGQSNDELEDAFSALDAHLDTQFEHQDIVLEKRFLRVREAVENAYKGLTKKISVNWHDDVLLPEAQAWTTYDNAFTSRATFDFARGVYKVETLLTQDVAQSLVMLQTFASKIAQSSQTELADADVFKQALESELQQYPSTPLVTAMSPATPYVDVSAILASDTATIIRNLTLDPIALRDDLDMQASRILENPIQAEKEEPKQTEKHNSYVQQQATEEVTARPQPTETEQAKVSLTIENKLAVKRLVLSIPFINSYQKVLLENKLDLVRELANKYQLDVSLVLAVIETESSFNPMATSPIPAFGLMQLVPHTAGLDAYEFLYGQREVVSPEYLFDQNNNLMLGIAYLHILSSRYLRGIQNQQSKLYCMLASYNTGVGNLARTFIQQKSLGRAVAKINSLEAAQTYAHLMEYLPAEETKNYLRKVLARKKHYASFD